MTMKILIPALLGAALVTPIAAQRVQGESSRYEFHVAGERVTSASAKWLLSSLLGEATKRGTFKYTTASGRTLPWNTYLILQVEDPGGGGGYIAVSPDRVPRSGAGFSGSTGGSPPWSRYIARRVRDGRLVDYYDAATAKAAYKRGLRVVEWFLAVPDERQVIERRRRELEQQRAAEQRQRERERDQGSTGTGTGGSGRDAGRRGTGSARTGGYGSGGYGSGGYGSGSYGSGGTRAGGSRTGAGSRGTRTTPPRTTLPGTTAPRPRQRTQPIRRPVERTRSSTSRPVRRIQAQRR